MLRVAETNLVKTRKLEEGLRTSSGQASIRPGVVALDFMGSAWRDLMRMS
jgi:hypothetical protein